MTTTHGERSPDAYAGDAKHLRQLLPKLEGSFTSETRATFEARCDSLIERSQTLSPWTFDMAVCEAVAAADNAHTITKVLPRLPAPAIRVDWFDDGLHVLRSAVTQPVLVGARIEEIEGTPIDQVAAQVEAALPGPPSRRRALGAALLTSSGALAGLNLVRDAGTLSLGYRIGGGDLLHCQLDSVSEEEISQVYPTDDPLRSLVSESELDWEQLLDLAPGIPISLRPPINKNLWAPRIAPSVSYLRLSHLSQTSNPSTDSWLEEILERLERRRPGGVAIDLRACTGGDYTVAVEFCQQLSQTIDRIAILVGKFTFSAGIVVAALLRGHGQSRTRIFGQPIGDREKFWAEGGVLVLPRTRLGVCFSTGLHDWGEASAPARELPWFNRIYGIAAGSLMPDFHVPDTAVDYAAGRDRTLESALTYLIGD